MRFSLLFGFTLMVLVSFQNLIAQPIVDYRPWQSPIKNQGGRGTCTAYAIAAILETRSGFPTDISEQHIYAWAKMNYYLKMPKHYDEGGFLHFYQDLLSKQGAVPEFKFPYDPKSPVWDETYTIRQKMEEDIRLSLFDMLKLDRYTYKAETTHYEEKQAKDVQLIKSLLDKGVRAIAVSYSMNGYYWSKHNGSASKKMTPWDFFVVRKDGRIISETDRTFSLTNWVDLFNRDEVEFLYKDTSYNVNAGHAVTIVGYDANGFLIKNSWGTDWGDQGYGWVSFDYHRLFAGECLFVKDYFVSGWKGEEPRHAASDIQLKSLPHSHTDFFTKKTSNCIELSLVYIGDKIPPRFKSITYNIYDQANKLIETKYGNTQGIYDGYLSGYATYVSCVGAPAQTKVHKVEAIMELTNGQKFTNYYYNLEPINRQYANK